MQISAYRSTVRLKKMDFKDTALLIVLKCQAGGFLKKHYGFEIDRFGSNSAHPAYTFLSPFLNKEWNEYKDGGSFNLHFFHFIIEKMSFFSDSFSIITYWHQTC